MVIFLVTYSSRQLSRSPVLDSYFTTKRRLPSGVASAGSWAIRRSKQQTSLGRTAATMASEIAMER